MAGIPSGYSRTVVHGTVSHGDVFQWGMWANEAPSDQAATQAQADSFAADLQTVLGDTTGIKSLISTDSSYIGVRVYSYLDDTGKATFIGDTEFSPVLGSGLGSLPDQTCLVATLLTGHAGRRNRGRIYLPCNGYKLIAGQLDQPTTAAIAANVASLIGLWNGHLGDQRISVLSQVAGSANPVTSVQVDSRTDVQRRRANREVVLFKASTDI